MRTTVAFLIGCVLGATGALMVKGAPVPPAAAAAPSPSPAFESLPEDSGASLLIPVRGVQLAALKSNFREPRGSGRTHEAMDIRAPRGTPVLAVADGTIKKLFNSKAGGLTIYHYDVAESTCYYYAHLESYGNIREGQHVRRGDVLGYVGTSGNAPPDTPHLHFAVNVLTATKEWWKGTPVDPYPYFTTPASALR
jgi:murein DD-endopeptidase MepM/ murein hydrolase activator NlpD